MNNNKRACRTSFDQAAVPTAKASGHASHARHGLGSLCILLAALGGPADAAASHDEAERLVKNQPCLAGETIDQFLDHTLKPSYRDLGWRVFARDGGFDVERAFLASKSMELRYRWRVGATKAPQPISERAEHLCS